MQYDNTLLIHAMPSFFVLIAVEIIYLHKEHRFTERKNEIVANIIIAIGAAFVSFITKGAILFVYTLLYQYRIFEMPDNIWWAWVICFFADDFSWYWFHRSSHKIRFLWASHAVHHSPEVFSLSAGMRVPWTSNITGNFLFWAWMPLIGITPAMIMLMKAVGVVYQFWLHTEAIDKMPKWFEAIFNTPSHHRVHHATNIEYLDKNHAGTLIIWDKFFGTFQEEEQKPVYGLTKKINSSNPVVIAFHEWKNLFSDFKKAKGIKDYANYLFNVPGWSNDGSSKTTKQLQTEIHGKKEVKIIRPTNPHPSFLNHINTNHMKKKIPIIAIVAITIFTAIGCKKENSEPAIAKSKLQISGLAYMQLTKGKYLIYKDSVSSDLDSVVVTNSSIKDVYSPPYDYLVLFIPATFPAYYYESFTLTLTKYNGMLQSEWFNGSTTPPIFYNSIVNDSFPVQLSEPDKAIAFDNFNNRQISFLVVEGKTYTQVLEYTWNTPNKKTTYYWAKTVGIIKRVVTIAGVTKTQTLLRNN